MDAKNGECDMDADSSLKYGASSPIPGLPTLNYREGFTVFPLANSLNKISQFFKGLWASCNAGDNYRAFPIIIIMRTEPSLTGCWASSRGD